MKEFTDNMGDLLTIPKALCSEMNTSEAAYIWDDYSVNDPYAL